MPRVQRECESSESRVQSRECRVESTENTRAHSREEGAQCTMRAQSERHALDSHGAITQIKSIPKPETLHQANH